MCGMGVRVRSTLEGMEVAELEGRPISDAAVRSAPEPCTVLCNILSY